MLIRILPVLGRILPALGAVAAIGCGSSIEADDFPINLCGDTLLTGIELTPPVDSLELRGNVGTIDRIGEPCIRAERRADCASAAREAKSDPGISVPTSRSEPPDREYFVYTRGDEVGTIGDLSALIAALGRIDRPAEARLLASVRGFRPACRLRERSGAFDAYAEQGMSCGQRDALVVRISAAGDVNEAERDVLQPANDGCTAGP
jgi:hypothetical protein